MKYTCTKTPSMFRKCDNIFLLCNVTHLRLGLGKLFMLGIHETWTFFPPNQKELKMKIEPAFSLILYLCSFLFMIQYDGRKMDRHFEKKLIWELFRSIGITTLGILPAIVSENSRPKWTIFKIQTNLDLERFMQNHYIHLKEEALKFRLIPKHLLVSM